MLEKSSTRFEAVIVGYLEKVLGSRLILAKPPKVSHIPFFLRDRYAFLEARVVERSCLFMVARDKAEPVVSIEKHIRQIQHAFPGLLVIAVFKFLDARTRSAFVAHHINFLVPENQMFIPDLAIDLRERFTRENERPRSSLSPSAQQIVVAAVLGRLAGDQPSQLAEELKTTAMSMGRAFEELANHGLAEVVASGREKHIAFVAHGRELWRRSRPLLRTPVRKRRIVGDVPTNFPGLIAGESALARYTSLNAPRTEVLAVSAAQWKTLAGVFKIEVTPYAADGEYSVETWSYDPAALSISNLVDPLSLYLSLQDEHDERIRMAAESLLEGALHERA
jgi:DNA-binding MarR family transcriptional regulator